MSPRVGEFVPHMIQYRHLYITRPSHARGGTPVRNARAGHAKNGSHARTILTFVTVVYLIVSGKKYFLICHQEHGIEKCYAEKMLSHLLNVPLRYIWGH